jgi:ribose 5-phosphate isomerase B
VKVAIGCDPNAGDLKSEIIEELSDLGHDVDDLGSDDPIYANVVITVGEAVADGTYGRGIVLCGTGIGASIAANKVPGVYCALVTDAYQAERAALSNNANVIALGAQVTGAKLARVLVRTWMAHEYVPGGRSEAKVKRISDYAENQRR